MNVLIRNLKLGTEQLGFCCLLLLLFAFKRKWFFKADLMNDITFIAIYIPLPLRKYLDNRYSIIT